MTMELCPETPAPDRPYLCFGPSVPDATVSFRGVSAQRATTEDLGLIAQWLRLPDTYEPLDFRGPVPRRYVLRHLVPARTGEGERVEYLMLREREHPLGFAICYEVNRAAACQEIDFARRPESPRMDRSLVHSIRVVVLGYVFAVRGAARAFWRRRRTSSPAVGRHSATVEHRFDWKRLQAEIERAMDREGTDECAEVTDAPPQ